MAIGNKNIERYLPVVKLNQGIKTAYPVVLSGTAATMSVGGTLSVTGTATFATTSANALSVTTLAVSSTAAVTGVLTPTGGVAAAGGFSNPTVFHSGGLGVNATTAATQTQIVTTNTYFCEVFIPANTTLTGISILNGATTSASQHMNVGLANSSGVVVAQSATTATQAAANAYQQIPFTTTYSAVGPAKYYICVQGDATTGFIATHTLGNYGATLKTSETYGTFVTTASYSTTTFTTARGPIADTY